MRYSPHLLDEIRARLPVSQVVGRKVALKKKGREYSGLSPFKAEKTASFFVNDQKGFYHCFASGEHGDIFTFLMKTEGLAFPEAVERLAEEAGVALPKPDAREEVRQDERQRLYALLEAAAIFFIDSYRGPAGAEARRYVSEKRGLKRDTVERFRIGFAPNSKSALREHLAKAGFTLEEMVAAGMLISGDDIPVAYDRFRNRVMFPITDLKGRVIAFGGRVLDADRELPGGSHVAKYLNSPETPLFHKGHVLFNAASARSPAHDKNRIIAVEGYMDVVALSEAGFPESVAPLGTALTEDQVKLLWRIVPEPILCFDGDSAGQKAAYRAVDIVLPHLKPGQSVAFAVLPEGLDPDDLIRLRGPEAMEQALAQARPLVDVLWDREFSAGTWNTPERKARLEAQLRQLVGRIEDASVRGHYEREIRQRLGTQFGAGQVAKQSGSPSFEGRGSPERRIANPGRGPVARGGAFPKRRWPPTPYDTEPKPIPSSALRSSSLVIGEGPALPPREALLLRTVLNHPWLIDDNAEELAELPLTSNALSRLRAAILSLHALDNSLDSASLRSQLSKTSLDRVVNSVEHAITHKSDRFAEPGAERGEVEVGWRHALALHSRQIGLRQLLEAAERAWHEHGDEEAQARIFDLKRQLDAMGGTDSADPSGTGV